LTQILATSDIEDEVHTGADGNELEALLSPEEVASACRLSRRAIYRAIKRGELPATRLCHRLRVHPADLERWISDRTVPTPANGGRISTGPAARAEPGSLRAMLDAIEVDGTAP
jgi:excisionase family DNA binding protein